jgi:hypothetical protein
MKALSEWFQDNNIDIDSGRVVVSNSVVSYGKAFPTWQKLHLIDVLSTFCKYNWGLGKT